MVTTVYREVTAVIEVKGVCCLFDIICVALFGYSQDWV